MLESPFFFLAFGIAVGLPFTLPTVTGVWRFPRLEKVRARQKKKPVSRQQRLDFANDLQRQLQEFTDDSRDIHVELQGEKGAVLFIKGGLSREEGEKLVAALRHDIDAHAFQRVEGDGEKGKWWVRISS